MFIRITNAQSCEVVEFNIDNNISRQALNRKIANIYRGIFICNETDKLVYPPRLPQQKIVIHEIMHLLPSLLKYSPLLLTPLGEAAENSYVLFLSNRQIKIFSLREGSFIEAGAFDAQKQYNTVSANSSDCGLTEEAAAILAATQPQCQGKLRLAYTNRNTIREDIAPTEPLYATDEEMKIEAYFRLMLLGMSPSIYAEEPLLDMTEQKYMYIARADCAEEPVFLKDESYYYCLGIKKGWNLAHEDKKIPPQLSYSFEKAKIIQHKDRLWALYKIYDMDFEEKRPITSAERKHDILVYCLNLAHDKERKQIYTMLYINRNMDEWEESRKQTLAGRPTAYVHLLEQNAPPGFETVDIRVIDGRLFLLP